MSNAARLTLFRVSQLVQMLRKAAEERDLLTKARRIVMLGAVVLAGAAAVVCTGAVVCFLVLPALVLLSPVLLAVSVLSVFRHRRSSRSLLDNQDSSVVAEVGFWSVVSDRYKSNVFEREE